MTSEGGMTPDFALLERAAAQGGTAALHRYAVAVLERTAAGRQPVRAVLHPLGFVCLPVLRDGGCGVCVHLFRPGSPAAGPDTGAGGCLDQAGGPAAGTGALHAHSWELTSCVLYGQLANVRLQVREDPVRPTHRIFEVRSDPQGVDDIRPTRRLVRYSPGRPEVSGTGAMYTLPAGEFHTTVIPDRQQAATVVLGRAVPGGADLVLGPLHGAAHRMERRSYDGTQTARFARAALGRMHGDDAP